MTEITQADRDVAARLAIGHPFTCFDCADELEQAFARHRQDAEAATIAKVVAWLRDQWRGGSAGIEVFDLADDIEAGEHLK